MQSNRLTTSGLQIYGKLYDVHNNVAYIMTQLFLFTAEMRLQSNLKVNNIRALVLLNFIKLAA